MLQWHYKAADPPGDCRSDLWFTHQLGMRLKKLYADSTAAARPGVQAPDLGLRSRAGQGRQGDTAGEPDALKILKEINGYQTADPAATSPASAS